MDRLKLAIENRAKVEDESSVMSLIFGSKALRDAEVEVTKAKYEVSGLLEEKIKLLESNLIDKRIELEQATQDIKAYKDTLSIFRKLILTNKMIDLRNRRDAISREILDIGLAIEEAQEYLDEITGEGWQHLPTILIGITGILAAGYGLYSSSEPLDFSIGEIGRTGFDNTQPGRISIR